MNSAANPAVLKPGRKVCRHRKLIAAELLLSLSLSGLLLSCSAQPPFDSGLVESGLNLEFLLGESPLPGPVPTDSFRATERSHVPGSGIEGVLTLYPGSGLSGIEVLEDNFSVAGNPQWNVTEFPPFSIELISDGALVLPVKQTPQRTAHPYWEVILGPGRTWQETAEGQWSRASLPLTLKEKNQNCTHNGMLTFAWKADGTVSRVAWQISSETCLYLKVNLWGVLAASFEPGPVAGRMKLLAKHHEAVAARMPVKPVEQFSVDFPQAGIAGVTPRGVEESSVYGFAIDGVNYRGGCQTRHGPYPFCDELIIPSYSLAKSIFAGLYYLHIIREWPDFAETPVSELVPECRLADARWDDVTMSDLINMTTGNYDAESFGKDEAAEKMQIFFLAETHAEKIAFSCGAWPRKSKPGSIQVYHTTDDYILGSAFTAYVRRKTGPLADIHRDFLFPRFFKPLNLSPLMQWTQRTYDDVAMPFTAYGLVLRADDLVRIATSINSAYGEQQLFDQEGFDRAMFRDNSGLQQLFPGRNEAYSNGFWGIDLSDRLNCDRETWIPFMSGYGGITVALMPNETIYYNFSDNMDFGFARAAIELNKIQDMCNN
jgi:hypothetical protein